MRPSMSDAAAHANKSDTNVKETIESILVAFILAFIFRCFVIEAFVIPTGSMAPTLLGAHMPMRCPDCGYRFTLSSIDQTDATYSIDANSRAVFTIFCPNCAYRFPRDSKDDPDNDATKPPLRYGDRILVMKYLYLLHDPTRWDVVVFKTPAPPMPGDYSINYIKRLVGLPGESLMVAEGDLYVAPRGADPTKPESYQIQTKPRPAQDALWRIVSDADYVPIGLSRKFENINGAPRQDAPWQLPWKPTMGDGWRVDDGRRFTFDDSAGAGELSFLPETNPNNSALTDWLAYDQSYRPDGMGLDMFGLDGYGLIKDHRFVQPVSDLKVSCVINKLEGPGVMQLILEKGVDRFTAELSQSGAKLTRQTSRPQAIVLSEAKLDMRMPMCVSLENVDHRVVLRINDKEVLATTPQQYAPNVAEVIDRVKNGTPPPQGRVLIRADRLKAEVTHLQLWRDVYYLDRDENNGRDARRASSRDFPNHVVTLKPHEFFVLGDNSYQSEDARFWNDDVDLKDENLKADAGRVPERFLLGKAFFVYWPAGYRPVSAVPPLMPNFGEMRLIR